MKRSLVCIVFMAAFYFGESQTNYILKWQNSYGGSQSDNAYHIEPTSDGGYIIAGQTSSDDGDVTGYHGGDWDYWVVKISSVGTIQWQRTYGGSNSDIAIRVRQTIDGGYIIAGETNSSDGDVTNYYGGEGDFWVIKTDLDGNIQWQKTYGGSGEEGARDIYQTDDNGYIIAGSTNSVDFNVSGNHGSTDYWVVKTDPQGEIIWQKCLGGSDSESANSIIQTDDNGYILAGLSQSNDGNVTGNHGSMDYWIVKLSSGGEVVWEKCFGGSTLDNAIKVLQTSDGGFILVGFTFSNDGDVSGNHGATDYWVIKLNPSGSIQWQKCYGGSQMDFAADVKQLEDGDYIISGATSSNDGDVSGNHSEEQYDYWLIKIDQSGTIVWQKCIGGSKDDEAKAVCPISNNGYIVTGATNSVDGDVIWNHGAFDYWVAELCLKDPLDLIISDSTYCYSTMIMATPGFTSYLWNTGDTTQSIEVYDSGVYRVTAHNSSGCPSQNEIHVPEPVRPFSGEQICMVTIDSVSGKNVIVIEKTLNVGTDSILIFRKDNLTSQYLQVGVLGINDMSIFIDTGSIPAQQSYQYTIAVKDTCGHISNLSTENKTILLQANTGINHEVNLFWNPYEGFDYPSFEIYRSTGGNPYGLIANVPNSTYAFTDLTPPTGVNYYQVRVTKDSPCDPSKSGYSQVRSNVISTSNALAGEPICMVTYDSVNIKNEIVFDKVINPAADSVVIYRLNEQASQYIAIGAVGINEISIYEDVDATPGQKSYQYKISVKDTSGNESEQSESHSTVFLQGNAGLNHEMILTWNPYEGFPYSSFGIYRSNAGGPWTLIGSVPSTNFSFTDQVPPAGLSLYQVRIEKSSPCSASKTDYPNVLSNTVSFNNVGMNEKAGEMIRLYPNPANDKVHVVVSTELVGSVFSITDRTGRILFTGKLAGEVSVIDLSGLSVGIYTFDIREKHLVLKIVKK